MKVVKLNDAEFREGLLKLRRRGGVYQKAAEEAARMITHFDLDIPEGHQVTNYGESRIKHCIKYDLPGGCRLVTVQNEGVTYILYVGDHDSADNWLDRHRGLTLSCDVETMRVKVVHVTKVVHEWRQPDSTCYTDENIPFFKRIPDLSLDSLVEKGDLRDLLLCLDEDSSEDRIQEVFATIEKHYPEEAIVLFEMLFELRRGDVEAAEMRLKLFRNKAVDLADHPSMEEEAIAHRINSDQLVVLNELTVAERGRLLKDDFQEWMIYLHPDQESVAFADFEKPVVLTGVSGSGKTCILIHRAQWLARKYPGQKIAIFTLNRSLARLLRNLVDTLCLNGESKQIEVFAFYDYFQDLLHKLGPQKYLEQLLLLTLAGSPMHTVIRRVNPSHFANEIDTRSGETLEDTWNDFFEQQNPEIKSSLSIVCRELESYNIDASRYLREEFTLIRSAFSPPDRARSYPGFDRAGRCIPFPTALRESVLRLLLLYEEFMLAGGVLDLLGLTQAVLPLWKEIRGMPEEARFRCVLVDEFQDFSTLDLNIIQHLPTSRQDGLFLTGDTLQKILVKRLKLTEAGLERGSAHYVSIRKNFRNSRQILLAASRLSNAYGPAAKKWGEEVEILDPELALRETSQPSAMRTNSQVAKAFEIAKSCMADGTNKMKPWTICVATANPDHISVAEILACAPPEIRAEELTGDYIRKPNAMVASTLSDLKGFEFNLVLIVGCEDGKFPSSGVHKDEVWRDALRLYVAMTRARDQLYLLYEAAPSEFLKAMSPELRWENEDAALKVQPHQERADPGVELSPEAKKRISRLLSESRSGDDRAPGLSIWAQEVLKRYFFRRVRHARADFRGFTDRMRDQYDKRLKHDFSEWLTVSTLKSLRASAFVDFQGLSLVALKRLKVEFEGAGYHGFWNIDLSKGWKEYRKQLRTKLKKRHRKKRC